MKKQFFSLSAIIAAVFMASCNNGSDTSSSTSTTDSSSMSTTTTAMDTGASGSKMTTDTAMSNNKMDTSSAGKMSTTAAPVNDKDKKFMLDAASGGMMEVQAGQLAATNGASDRVKAYGNMMVQDHTNANNELKALASSKNVMLPDSLMAKHSAHLAMLKKKTGKDFDKAYMSMMLMDHNEDVSKFQMESKSASDADLKAFATKTLPVLKTHLDSAKAINHMKM